MQEKDMVLDVLSGTKSSIGNYAKIITETSDQNLRQKFQQMRDSDEKFQYDLYKKAEQLGYYKCGPKATQSDEQSVKSALSSSMTSPSGSGMQQNDTPNIPGIS